LALALYLALRVQALVLTSRFSGLDYMHLKVNFWNVRLQCVEPFSSN
jgi:hypothetical protein